ncbi:MAG: hypothetical protein ACOYYS_08855 [Chloroflexota bacterium]
MLKRIFRNKRVLLILLTIAVICVPLSSAMAAIRLQVPAGWSRSGNAPVAVYPSSGIYECDDYWIVFANVPQNKIMPVNKLKISATNVLNQAHIVAHGGLTGFTECASNSCAVHLCGKDNGLYNGGSHRLEIQP